MRKSWKFRKWVVYWSARVEFSVSPEQASRFFQYSYISRIPIAISNFQFWSVSSFQYNNRHEVDSSYYYHYYSTLLASSNKSRFFTFQIDWKKWKCSRMGINRREGTARKGRKERNYIAGIGVYVCVGFSRIAVEKKGDEKFGLDFNCRGRNNKMQILCRSLLAGVSRLNPRATLASARSWNFWNDLWSFRCLKCKNSNCSWTCLVLLRIVILGLLYSRLYCCKMLLQICLNISWIPYL